MMVVARYRVKDNQLIGELNCDHCATLCGQKGKPMSTSQAHPPPPGGERLPPGMIMDRDGHIYRSDRQTFTKRASFWQRILHWWLYGRRQRG